ncbi:lasso peptide biosynthesis B2 protein [Pseudonocardia sp. TRM90224]|uniref:lasso peptide biosynthesis B2 protein n=1 Tax=Pseudonocardia sp. TRM90224 TaxID=2812678 RepID=UPI001E4822EF|nr:lasso peptide biosynthesis B2 protein [Pseudonocardia sp. TRM90224]
MSSSQALQRGERPPLGRRLVIHVAVGIARGLARLAPVRIRRTFELLRRGAAAATHEQALAARQDVVAVSVFCSGRYCLERSIATAIVCRLRGVWPVWCTGVRTPPFEAHAWVEVDGVPVGEPTDTVTYRHLIVVAPV